MSKKLGGEYRVVARRATYFPPDIYYTYRMYVQSTLTITGYIRSKNIMRYVRIE